MGDPFGNQDSYGFGFNDSNFSDRVLRIEIISEPEHTRCNRKRGREVWEEENGDDTNDTECSLFFQVKTYHINSLILAGKSPFFYKMFQNGMKESQQQHATLKINASEEASVMEVLRFMYSNTLRAVTASEFVDVLIAADKFEVSSCVSYCSKKMIDKLPMSLESALLYLHLPSNLLASKPVQQLVDATNKYLVSCYGDFTKPQPHRDAMSLPLPVLEAVLGSDDVKARSEDDVFDFVLKWATARCPCLEERKEVLGSHLLRLVRFPYLSLPKLKEARACRDFAHDDFCELISDALFSKADQDAPPAGSLGFPALTPPRVYLENLPLKIVRFLSLDRPHCLVYMELKKQDVVDEKSIKELVSETFWLGSRKVSLRLRNQGSSGKPPVHEFGIAVCVDASCNMDCVISAMGKSKGFQSIGSAKNWSVQGGINNALPRTPANRNTPSSYRIMENEFLLYGVLHLRLDLILN